MFPIKRFYQSDSDFQRFYQSLKQVRCPHCKRLGTLILHGYLYGYSDHGTTHRIVRGRRLFCSNRYRRPGCGKTVSILDSIFLRGFVITAVTLWNFLKNIAASAPKCNAFEDLDCSLCASAAYRLLQRVQQVQSRIRSFLFRRIPIPETPHTHNPLIATLAHLQVAFPQSNCPIADFQNTFRTAFL